MSCIHDDGYIVGAASDIESGLGLVIGAILDSSRFGSELWVWVQVYVIGVVAWWRCGQACRSSAPKRGG